MDKQIASACWVVCPLCDQDRCVGKENCEEVKAYVETLQKEANQLKHKLAHLTPCDACVYDPPSSFGGKPCAFCVAQGRIAEDD